MDSSMQEQLAAFRYSLIAPIVSRQTPLAPGELKAYLAQAAEKGYNIPGSAKTTVSVRTLERWLSQYRTGEWDGLKPRGRTRKTNLRIPPAVLQEAIRLRKQRPQRSVEQIIFLLEEGGAAEAGTLAPSTLSRHLRKAGASRNRGRALKLAVRLSTHALLTRSQRPEETKESDSLCRLGRFQPLHRPCGVLLGRKAAANGGQPQKGDSETWNSIPVLLRQRCGIFFTAFGAHLRQARHSALPLCPQ